MKVLVNTPTGHIGAALAANLLEADVEFSVVARNPDKVKALAKKGVTVHQGDLTDASFVTGATRGIDLLFWVTPPNYDTTDMRAFQNLVGDNAAAAVKANGIERVIDLSSIGAQHAEGTGPIAGLHDVEKKLEETPAKVLHLRPSYFMENLFQSIQGIATDGCVYMPAAPGDVMSMVATRDIARLAANLIARPEWDERTVIELLGPEDITFADAARTVGEAIGRDIKHVQVTPEQSTSAMLAMGLNESLAALFNEMYAGFSSGLVAPETSNIRRGETTFKQFAEEVFKPAYEAMTG